MKELSIEEKAKRYDEALDKIADAIEAGSIEQGFAKWLFPELAESEDERIRKALIELVKQSGDILYPSNQKSMLAWLEKQGERKVPVIDFKAKDWYVSKVDGKIRNIYHSVDKVEPKFKVGDWITNGDYTWKIVEVKPLDYILQSQDGNIVDDTISHVDEQFHSFTIEDAKDGDVLCVKYGNDEMPFIFTGKQDNVAYCALNSFGEFVLSIAEWLLKISVLPATKEQHDILFAKMKKAGYEWDAEKKELKKINTYCQNNCNGFQETGKCFAEGDCEAKKNALKNKSYDDELLESAIAFIESSNKFCEWKGNSKKDVLDWIDSLKHRVQQKQEWTEEDIHNIENIDSVLFYDKDLPEDTCIKLHNWLQSLKPNKDMIEALRTEYEKGRADVLRCIDPDVMVADFCSQPLSKTRSIASVYRQGITDILKRINSNEENSITGTCSIDNCGL